MPGNRLIWARALSNRRCNSITWNCKMISRIFTMKNHNNTAISVSWTPKIPRNMLDWNILCGRSIEIRFHTFWLQSCDSRCLAALSVGSFSKLKIAKKKTKWQLQCKYRTHTRKFRTYNWKTVKIKVQKKNRSENWFREWLYLPSDNFVDGWQNFNIELINCQRSIWCLLLLLLLLLCGYGFTCILWCWWGCLLVHLVCVSFYLLCLNDERSAGTWITDNPPKEIQQIPNWRLKDELNQLKRLFEM